MNTFEVELDVIRPYKFNISAETLEEANRFAETVGNALKISNLTPSYTFLKRDAFSNLENRFFIKNLVDIGEDNEPVEWNVTLKYKELNTAYATVTIEALDEDEALNKAIDYANDYGVDGDVYDRELEEEYEYEALEPERVY